MLITFINIHCRSPKGDEPARVVTTFIQKRLNWHNYRINLPIKGNLINRQTESLTLVGVIEHFFDFPCAHSVYFPAWNGWPPINVNLPWSYSRNKEINIKKILYGQHYNSSNKWKWLCKFAELTHAINSADSNQMMETALEAHSIRKINYLQPDAKECRKHTSVAAKLDFL